MNNEPTLQGIDDFDNNESPEKRKTVGTVIIGLIVMSIIYGAIKFYLLH